MVKKDYKLSIRIIKIIIILLLRIRQNNYLFALLNNLPNFRLIETQQQC